MGWGQGLLVTLLLVVSLGLPLGTAGAPPVPLRVMLDAGDGSAHWATLTSTIPGNALNATRAAAPLLNATVVVTSTGTDVTSMVVGGEWLNDTSPSGPYWHLLVWRGGRWTLPDVPARALATRGGDVIAWYYVADDPAWDGAGPWLGPWPEGTPTDPFPVTSAGYSMGNLGMAGEAPTDPPLAWSTPTGDSFPASGQPLEVGGLLVLQGARDLWALNASEGTLAWTRPGLGGQGSMAVFNNTILVVSNGTPGPLLHALARTNGGEVWNETLPSALAAAPRVSGRTAVLPLGDRLQARDANTGLLLWQYMVNITPPATVAAIRDRVLVGRILDDQVTALDLTQGTVLWTHSVPRPRRIMALPGGDTMVVGRGLAVRLRADGSEVRRWENLWSFPTFAAYDGSSLLVAARVSDTGRQIMRIDAAGGVVWRYPSVPDPLGPVLAADDSIILLRGNATGGTLEGIDAATGQPRWSRTVAYNATNVQSVLANGGLITASADGVVRAYYTSEPFATSNPTPPPTPWTLTVALGVTGAMAIAVAVAWRRRHKP